jgi:hypothetical protein
VQQFGGGLYTYCGSRTAGSSQKKVFAPRFGFAYSPSSSNKTVVRGGYGIFYDTAEQFEDIGSGNIYPYTVRTSIYNTTPGSMLNSNDMFPSFTAPLPVTKDALSFYEPQARVKLDPYVQEWSLAIERELTHTTKLEISYLGSKGTHLNIRGETDQPYPYDPANPTPMAARLPYSNFATIVESYWMGNSSYNAANIKLEQRTGDLSLLAAYTWGHSLDNKSAAAGVAGDDSGWAGTLDMRNPNRDHASSSYDATQRFVASFVYNLPVGKGKHFLGGLSGPANVALGGWQVNGIVTFQGGFPFSIGALDIQALNNLMGPRADLVGNPNPSGFNKSIYEWFNTAAFAQPALGVIGNTGRNIVRAPGLNNWDMSLFKNIPLGERLRLQLRGEFFNAPNHTQFGYPDAYIQDATFGVIGSARAPRIIQVAMKFIF